MTPEQKQRIEQILENRRIWYGGYGQLTSDFDFLLSLVSQESGVNECEEMLSSIQSRDYAFTDRCGRQCVILSIEERDALCRSVQAIRGQVECEPCGRTHVTPRDTEHQQELRCKGVWYFANSAQSTNRVRKIAEEVVTNWAGYANPADATEGVLQYVATSMRSACIEKVKAMGQQWYAEAKKRGAAFSDKGRLAETIAKELESVSVQEQKK